MPTSYAIIVAVSTGTVAISASSLRTCKALIALSPLYGAVCI